MEIEERLWPETVGEAVYLLRRRSTLDRAEVAERAQVALSTYVKYENGTTRSGIYDVAVLRRILRVLADDLDVPLPDLWKLVAEVVDRAEATRFSIARQSGGMNAGSRDPT